MFNHVAEAVAGLSAEIELTNAQLIRVEGVNGVGKSTLADLLAAQIQAEHFDTDRGFRFDPGTEWQYFVETVRKDDFCEAVALAMRGGRRVVASSICLADVLPEADFGRGFRIYVARIQPQFHALWRWEYLKDIVLAQNHGNEIDKSVAAYHWRAKPHVEPDALVLIKDGIRERP